jgi:hypothetical protein
MKQIDKRAEKIKNSLLKGKDLPGLLELRKLKCLFNSLGNPIYIWEAYATCREYEIDIPNWILEYFDSCTKKLIRISPSNSERARDKVYQALKFNDKNRSPFARRVDVEIAINIAIHVCDLKDKGKKLTIIYDELAEEYSVSEKTIERHYRKYEELINAPLP